MTAPSPQTAPRRRFEKKVAVVTGGASGIGRAMVEALAREGANVAFCDRDAHAGADVEATLREAGLEVRFRAADLEDPEQIRRFTDGAVELYGGLDVAMNNAGINFFRTLHEIDVEDWDRMFRINTRAVFLGIKYQAPHLLARGGGAIVVTGSAIQEASRPGGAAYAASKRALMGIVQSAALDYGPRGVRVNLIAPGTTDTPMARQLGARASGDPEAWSRAQAQWAEANIPAARRLATAEEIAAAALMLAGDDCPFLNGAGLVVDGGMTAKLS